MAGTLEIDDPAPGVRRLTLANRGRSNALDLELLDRIAAAVDAAGRDDGVRCLLLAAAGEQMFSAGYDIVGIDDDDFPRQAERRIARPSVSALTALDSTPLPTIAVISGHALGGGLELACACDLRVAVASAELGMPAGRLGLVYSHTGVARFLRIVGEARTRELFLVGARIGAATAATWGLVNDVFDDHDALAAGALELAGRIVANAPLSVRGNKRLIDTLASACDRLDSHTEAELIALRRAAFGSADLREGVRAFAEKRAPVWQGR